MSFSTDIELFLIGLEILELCRFLSLAMCDEFSYKEKDILKNVYKI